MSLRSRYYRARRCARRVWRLISILGYRAQGAPL